MICPYHSRNRGANVGQPPPETGGFPFHFIAHHSSPYTSIPFQAAPLLGSISQQLAPQQISAPYHFSAQHFSPRLHAQITKPLCSARLHFRPKHLTKNHSSDPRHRHDSTRHFISRLHISAHRSIARLGSTAKHNTQAHFSAPRQITALHFSASIQSTSDNGTSSLGSTSPQYRTAHDSAPRHYQNIPLPSTALLGFKP